MDVLDTHLKWEWIKRFTKTFGSVNWKYKVKPVSIIKKTAFMVFINKNPWVPDLVKMVPNLFSIFIPCPAQGFLVLSVILKELSPKWQPEGGTVTRGLWGWPLAASIFLAQTSRGSDRLLQLHVAKTGGSSYEEGGGQPDRDDHQGAVAHSRCKTQLHLKLFSPHHFLLVLNNQKVKQCLKISIDYQCIVSLCFPQVISEQVIRLWKQKVICGRQCRLCDGRALNEWIAGNHYSVQNAAVVMYEPAAAWTLSEPIGWCHAFGHYLAM